MEEPLGTSGLVLDVEPACDITGCVRRCSCLGGGGGSLGSDKGLEVLGVGSGLSFPVADGELRECDLLSRRPYVVGNREVMAV